VSLIERWGALSPNAKRASVIGAAAVAILGLAAGSAIVSPPPSAQRGTPRDALVRNILTDTDPRSLGVEAMAARLERMERKVADLRAKAEALPPAAPSFAADNADSLTRQVEIEALRLEVEELRRTVKATKSAEDERPSLPRPVAEPLSPPPTKPALAVPQRPRVSPPGAPLEELFAPPVRGQGLSPAPNDAVRPTGSGAGRGLSIRTVAQANPEGGAQGKGAPKAASKDAVYIPAGAILRGIFLNGLDMPTGQQARSQPTPALIRVRDLAILPNRVRADVRECFVIVGGFGDLASERAYLRGETLTCVRADGGVIEVPVEAYAVGEDGKVGLRGRVVSKQGAMLAKALQAGFLQSFAQMFNQVPAIPVSNVSNGSGNQLPYQSMLSGQSAAGAAARGVGGAMDRLANYYMDLAEQTFPVLEVDAGRGVELILNAGVSLRLAH
jgi:conjugal transfer pilus assembly protein TraB